MGSDTMQISKSSSFQLNVVYYEFYLGGLVNVALPLAMLNQNFPDNVRKTMSPT